MINRRKLKVLLILALIIGIIAPNQISSAEASVISQDVLKQGDTVILICRNDVVGGRILNGNVEKGKLSLVKTPNQQGNVWKVSIDVNGYYMFECLSDKTGNKWLNGVTSNGAINLAPVTTGNYTGTKWRFNTTSTSGLFSIECMGNIEGKKWLKGNTAWANVYLHGSSENYWSFVKVPDTYLTQYESAPFLENSNNLTLLPDDLAGIEKYPEAGTNNPENGTPSYIDLTDKFPDVGNQGKLNSCVAFAFAYCKTYQEGIDWKWNVKNPTNVFSPAFIYNQKNHGTSVFGSEMTFKEAFNILKTQGCTTIDDMPYIGVENGYSLKAGPSQYITASRFKADKFYSLMPGDVEEIKTRLAAKKPEPVIIGLPVTEEFHKLNEANNIYKDTTGQVLYKHAVCIIGYDDSLNAFKIINSWGTSWGQNGYGWIDYNVIKERNIQGYIMTDATNGKTTPWYDGAWDNGDKTGYWSKYKTDSSQDFHYTGDFNGDGKSDFMYWCEEDTEPGWRVLLSNGAGWDDKYFGHGDKLGYWSGHNKTPISSQSFQFTGDFNGDGKTDFMYWSEEEKGWRVLLSTGSGWNDKFFGKGDMKGYWTGHDGTPLSSQSFHFTGDFNGDGMTDFMYWSKEDEGGWRVLLSTGEGWNDQFFGKGEMAGFWSGFRSTPSSTQSFHFIGDFNGDGKTDFMYWSVKDEVGGWRVLLSTGSGWNDKFFGNGQYYYGYWPDYNKPGGRKKHQFVGDFNGDGMTDFMCWDIGDGWRVLLSTGSGWNDILFGRGEKVGGNTNDNSLQDFHQLGDFNGDGKTDIMYRCTEEGWRVLLSTGKGWQDQVFGYGNGLGYWKYFADKNPTNPQNFHLTGDFNGDRKTDFMYWNEEEGKFKIHVLISTKNEGDEWKEKTNLTSEKSRSGSAELSGKIYVAGGNNGSYCNSFDSYDPDSNTWTPKSNMPTAREGLAVVALDGKIYAIGGKNRDFLDRVEVYDPSNDSWTVKASMPTKRAYIGATIIDNKIYVVGGCNKDKGTITELDNVEVYDPATDAWTTKSPMQNSRKFFSTASVNNKIYVFGGYKNQNFIRSVEEYDPATDKWVSKANLKEAKYGMSTAVLNNKIYIIGGFDGTYSRVIEEYDPDSDSYIERMSMQYSRAYSTAGVLNDKIYVMGGFCDPNILDKVEEYSPLTLNEDIIGNAVAATFLNDDLYVVANNHIWKRNKKPSCSDSSRTNIEWVKSGVAKDVVSIAALNNELYVASDNSIKKRVNLGPGTGESWEELIKAPNVVSITSYMGELYAVFDKHLWKLVNGGTNYVWQDQGILPDDVVGVISYNDELYINLDGKIFKRNQGGEWTESLNSNEYLIVSLYNMPDVLPADKLVLIVRLSKDGHGGNFIDGILHFIGLK